MIMDQIISNKFDSRMSQQAIGDVLNAKITLRRLHSVQDELDYAKKYGIEIWNTKLLKNNMRELSATLHKYIVGWS